ncbi:hypothetical protein CEN46_06830 [Fischerella thermalis CCMEE 5318]|uniref:Uncharacterized protein n=1 Tax=Fischerella thermalis CCMEE 5318 TaxID=2019666 RepID=A0A2N6LJU2_9CYAN|nr:hypothetical protein CEN46_06830 [Fischerella thermalis CCMEE 5318]PMB42469.1 hypothetical protein CEN47_01260 [Fischerella thermalis CCMEE 5319]
MVGKFPDAIALLQKLKIAIAFTLCLRVLVFQPITTQTPSNIIRPLVKIFLPHPNPKRNQRGGEHRWTQIDYPLHIFGKMNK